MEERRVSKLKDVMDMVVTAQQTLLNDMSKTEADFKETVSKINGLEDIQSFIGINKTGLQPPKPTEYEPYKGKHEQFKKKSIPAAVAVTVRKNEPSPVKSTRTPSGSASPNTSGDRGVPERKQGKIAKALYEYVAADATELSFSVGDTITVTKIDDSGWWEGENNGNHGMFPGNYVKLEEDSGKRRCLVSNQIIKL